MVTKRLKVKVDYLKEKDVLTIQIVPQRDLETRARGLDYDFLIFHAKDNLQDIVGMQSMDFSKFARHLKADMLPVVGANFDVIGTDLRGINLKQLLEWAYSNFVLQDRWQRFKQIRQTLRKVGSLPGAPQTAYSIPSRIFSPEISESIPITSYASTFSETAEPFFLSVVSNSANPSSITAR
jgi:hypothetical protein